jgi:hypothetical protein
MEFMKFKLARILVTLAISGLFLISPGQAQTTVSRTQTIQLKTGWNAVFLQVQASNATPAQLFATLPVDIVATFFAADRAVEFINDPSETQWKKEGWGVWYSLDRPDNFLSSLYNIDGNRSYLVFARQDCVWTVEGKVLLEPIRWKSDSFNLVGFTLDGQSPPTFQRFFKSSKAQQTLKAYRLISNKWTLVSDPASVQMKDGEAYWIYSEGGSDYQGPLNVNLPFGVTVDFTPGTEVVDVILRSDSADPLTISVQPPGESVVPLAYVVRAISPGELGQRSIPLNETVQLPVLEPFNKTALRLELRREKMTAPQQAGLLKIIN